MPGSCNGRAPANPEIWSAACRLYQWLQEADLGLSPKEEEEIYREFMQGVGVVEAGQIL